MNRGIDTWKIACGYEPWCNILNFLPHIHTCAVETFLRTFLTAYVSKGSPQSRLVGWPPSNADINGMRCYYQGVSLSTDNSLCVGQPHRELLRLAEGKSYCNCRGNRTQMREMVSTGSIIHAVLFQASHDFLPHAHTHMKWQVDSPVVMSERSNPKNYDFGAFSWSIAGPLFPHKIKKNPNILHRGGNYCDSQKA